MIYKWTSLDDILDEYQDIAITISDMAGAYYYFGKLNQAIKLLNAGQMFVEQATGKEIKSGTFFSFTTMLSKILCASIFYQNTHLDKVLPTLLLNRQLAEADHNGKIDSQAVADALEYLGLAHYYHKLNTGEGASSTSLAYFQQALELRQDTQIIMGKSESLFHIGLLYENGDQPDIDKALFYYEQAYQSAIELHDELEQSYAARHLGSIAETQGNYEQARHYYEESLALRKQIDFRISFPFSHLALGDLHQTRDEPAKALTCFEEALTIAKTQGAARWMPAIVSRIEGLAS